MYIVIEGLDKTGKTSLSNYLAKELKLPIKKFSRPQRDPYCEYMEFLLTDYEPSILDRFYLGELAYGPVKRGKSELSDEERRNIEMTMLAHNPFLIYADTDTKTIQSNFRKDGETYTQVKDVVPLKKAYKQAMDTGILTWHKFDYQKDKSYKKLMEKIIPWYEDSMNRNLRLTDLRETRMIGNPDAEILIVGDICNTTKRFNKDPKLVVPFASGPAATYLYNALRDSQIDLNDIAITNYRKYHNGTSGIWMETKEMKNLKRIVYLGRYDKNGFNLLGDQVQKTIRHPSWAARFNYRIKKYSKELREAIYG